MSTIPRIYILLLLIFIQMLMLIINVILYKFKRINVEAKIENASRKWKEKKKNPS